MRTLQEVQGKMHATHTHIKPMPQFHFLAPKTAHFLIPLSHELSILVYLTCQCTTECPVDHSYFTREQTKAQQDKTEDSKAAPSRLWTMLGMLHPCTVRSGSASATWWLSTGNRLSALVALNFKFNYNTFKLEFKHPCTGYYVVALILDLQPLGVKVRCEQSMVSSMLVGHKDQRSRAN